MDFALQWLLLGLPVAFALGWMASRLDLRQLKRQNRDNPRAYFKGLNLLLNEQQDKAVDAFIEAVQNDPDTAELHFALGNLFRRRGEIERAVRVHEHLLARSDLPAAERDRAQYALAQDFLRAGLFDRAEAACRKLEGTAFENEGRLARLTLYERSRDWPAAAEVAAQLERAGQGSFAGRIAHYACEQAQDADAAGQADAALAALQRARQAAPEAARPWVVMGQRLAAQGDAAGAVQAWNTLLKVQPASFNLIAHDYAQACAAAGLREQGLQALRKLYAAQPSMKLLQAMGLLEGEGAVAGAQLLNHLQSAPSLSAAQALLAQAPETWGAAGLEGIRQAVARAAGPLQRYRCAGCGFEARHYFWQCPGCLGWDSFPPQPIEEL